MQQSCPIPWEKAARSTATGFDGLGWTAAFSARGRWDSLSSRVCTSSASPHPAAWDGAAAAINIALRGGGGALNAMLPAARVGRGGYF